MVRCKFKVVEIMKSAYDGSGTRFRLSAVNQSDKGPEEDSVFGKYTPSGELTMVVKNPDAEKQIELGKSYYLDITPAEG